MTVLSPSIALTKPPTDLPSSVASTTQCHIEPSDLGPFSPDRGIGRSMTQDQALARMEQDDIVGWLAVTADGPWDRYWDQATNALGSAIHLDLTWLDVNGQIHDLYETDEVFSFRDLRVSRSFQGKIEHTSSPLYLPLQDVGLNVNYDATCVVESVEFGDDVSDQLFSPALAE